MDFLPSVFPAEIADQLASTFEQSTFEQMEQRVEGHYSGDQKMAGDAYPSESEVYTSRFGRCRRIEPELRAICRKHVLPHLGLVSKWEVRAHRMLPGDHFRAHTDHRVGDLGFTICLTKGWKMDWGGLLISSTGFCIPLFNDLVIVGPGVPHCVSSVEPWARVPRYMIVGFAKR